MEKSKRSLQIGILSLLSLLLISCIALEVKENIKNPNSYFRRAYRDIERIHKRYPGREGKPHSVHVLLYDGSHRKLIKAAVPVWAANSCKDIEAAAKESSGFEFGEEYDIDWRGIDNLGDVGPGLLFELSDQKSKILIWLE
jgi:hypothetical protein